MQAIRCAEVDASLNTIAFLCLKKGEKRPTNVVSSDSQESDQPEDTDYSQGHLILQFYNSPYLIHHSDLRFFPFFF